MKLLNYSFGQYPKFKTGHIVRIHRLAVFGNSFIASCLGAKDLVIFSPPFRDANLSEKIRTAAKQYTLQQSDMALIKQLRFWFVDRLVSNHICDLPDFGYHNIVGQVISTHLCHAERLVTCIWDGTRCARFNQPPYEASVTQCIQNDDLFELSDGKRIYITIYGRENVHKFQAIKPASIVSFFGLKMNETKIILQENCRNGQQIRNVHRYSILGSKWLECLSERDKDLTFAGK